MSNKRELLSKLRGFDCAFLITPGDERRAEITCEAIDACKEAGIKYVLLISVVVVDTPTLFGKQFKQIEDHLRGSGMTYGIIRAPSFVDNLLHFKEDVMYSKVLPGPLDPEKSFSWVTLKDLGICAAKILTECHKYPNKVWHLSGPSLTYNKLTQTFNNVRGVGRGKGWRLGEGTGRPLTSLSLCPQVLGRQIAYKQLPTEQFKERLSDAMPEYAAQGTMEVYDLIQKGRKDVIDRPTDDIKNLAGRDPLTVENWLQEHKAAFSSQAA